MQTTKSKSRHLIITTFTFALLFTIFYTFYIPSNDQELIPDLASLDSNIGYTACDKVDIPWLAGDRLYWNGWDPKAMFMKNDGTLTKANLGPTPAYSPQTEKEHLGPIDSISVFAQGEFTTQTIKLKQHTVQPNAYFAPVKFYRADNYQLLTIEEHRSYFWENPIYHAYRSSKFKSDNRLIVNPYPQNETLPSCNFHTSRSSISGTWIDSTVYSKSNRPLFHKMYESSDKEMTENNKIFVPNTCQLEYKSNGFGSQCLGNKTIHAWGDNNLKRNIKAFNFNTGTWCDTGKISQISNPDQQREASQCICHDDYEDSSIYPWIHDPNIPLNLNNGWGSSGASIYYQPVAGILNHEQLLDQMKLFVTHQKQKADFVIIGLGNNDIQSLQVSPKQFQIQFNKLMRHIREIYPTQKILIRTTQYFCCGLIPSTSWSAGRSSVFNDIIRSIIAPKNNILLWDTFILGTNENTCLSEGSSYSRRNVISLENQFLWNLLC